MEQTVRFGQPQGCNVDHLVRELEGYVEAGMKNDALALARQFLTARPARVARFSAAMETLLIQADRLGQWRRQVERAFASLSVKAQRSVRCLMFRFYASLDKWSEAREFMPARCCSAVDLFFAMETLLNLRDGKAAHRIERACLRRLRTTSDRFEQAMLWDALANYDAYCFRLGGAEECWLAAPNVLPFIAEKTRGLVEIATVRAMLFVWAGLREVDRLRKEAGDENAVMLPGNTKAILDKLERDLWKYQHVLEKIVPSSEAWRFGVETKAND